MDEDRDVPAEVARAWVLRRRGWSVREIAADLGCSVSTAHARVKAAQEAEVETGVLDRDAQRTREAAALDSYTSALEAALDLGAVTALEVVPVLLRVSARRAKLLGLDMPARVEVTETPAGARPDPEIVAKLQQAREVNRRDRARWVPRGVRSDERAELPPDGQEAGQDEDAERDGPAGAA